MTDTDFFTAASNKIEYQIPPTIIKVVGIGNCGNNAINRMKEAGIEGVDFIGINTDNQKLRECQAETTILIGDTGGRGAGGDPELGRQAAEASVDAIRGAIKGAHMVIISTGMGGGTGTGASPIVARIAREENCLTVGVVTFPWKSEHGKPKIAKKGIEEIMPYMDSLIVIQNDRISDSIDLSTVTPTQMYSFIDKALRDTVRAIIDIIILPGVINADFNDVKAVLENSGTAIVGIGECAEDANWKVALDSAMKNPMLEDYDITRAKKILVIIITNEHVSSEKLMALYNDIGNIYGANANTEDKSTKIGHVHERRLDNKIRVVLIGTGFKSTKYGDRKSFQSPADKTKKTSAKENNEDQMQLPLNTEINFDKPAYEVWKPSGKLDNK